MKNPFSRKFSPRQYYVIYEVWAWEDGQYRMNEKYSDFVDQTEPFLESEDIREIERRLKPDIKTYEDIVITHWERLNNV